MCITTSMREIYFLKFKHLLHEKNQWYSFLVNGSYNLAISIDGKTACLLCNDISNKNHNEKICLYIFQQQNKEWLLVDVRVMLNNHKYVVNSNTPIILSEDNSTIVVGLPSEDTVYVFKLSITGIITLKGMLKGVCTKKEDLFGFSVAANDDCSIITIGAPDASIDGYTSCGAAYVFNLNDQKMEYVQHRKVSPHTMDDNIHFGHIVESSQDSNYDYFTITDIHESKVELSFHNKESKVTNK